MNRNSTLPLTLADQLMQLGGVPAERVRLSPTPGQATLEDLMAINREKSGLCELVDGTLVEKAMGYEQSVIAGTILRILSTFVHHRRLGLVSGADGFFQLQSSTRGPDVAYLSRERLPAGKIPADAYPRLAPNLVVEVLSRGNTKSEMMRKRLEYFHSGVEIVWIVDCVHRSVAVYTSPSEVQVLGEQDTVDAGIVLPEFSSLVADFFADIDLGLSQEANGNLQS